MFSDVYHISYLTDDLAAAKSFYQRTFDAEVALESDNAESGSRMAFLKVGKTGVELIEPADKARLGGRTGLILDHIGYVVESLEVEMARLTEKGVGFATDSPRINPEGARLIYLAAGDALGTRIHLTERPPVREGQL